jgi:hypothetical protein
VCTPVIPAPRRLRQEDREFEGCLGYIVKPCVKKEKKKKNCIVSLTFALGLVQKN